MKAAPRRDPVFCFLDAMAQAGAAWSEPLADRLGAGELVRFACDGQGEADRHGNASAAWLFTNGHPCGGWLLRGGSVTGLWAMPPRPIPEPSEKRPRNRRDRAASPKQVKD